MDISQPEPTVAAPRRDGREVLPGALGRLIDALEEEPGAVSLARLGALLAQPFPAHELAPWAAFDAPTRARTLVCRTARYEILVLGWLPGQASSVHDHGASACGVRVIEGLATERVALRGALGDPRAHAPGAILARGPGEWHEIRNDGEDRLLTLHVYSPPLSYDGVVPPARDRRPAVVVVGGGFCAATIGVELARRGALGEIALTVVEPGPTVGRGLAYDAHPSHRLNVPVERMGIADDPPGTFLAWVRDRGHRAEPGDFVPRNHFGAYVGERWGAEGAGQVTHARAVATDLVRESAGWRVCLDDGSELLADAVVLATGNAAPRAPAALPLEVRAGPRYVARPWAPEALAHIGATEPVLVVGTGLTAMDVLVSLRSSGHRARVTLLSRRGMLPRPHATVPPTRPAPDLALDGDLFTLLAEVRTAAAAAEARGEPWQAVFDRVRPRVPEVWARLSDADKGRFLRHLRPWWDVHRHRVPADLHRELARLREAGTVDVIAGSLVWAAPVDGGLRVAIRRRGRDFPEHLHVAHVVNATGPDLDLAVSGDPLTRRLLARGVLAQDPHAVGLVTGRDGAALDGAGERVDGLFVVGGARRAAEWECTAVPELRVQARAILDGLVGVRV